MILIFIIYFFEILLNLLNKSMKIFKYLWNILINNLYYFLVNLELISQFKSFFYHSSSFFNYDSNKSLSQNSYFIPKKSIEITFKCHSSLMISLSRVSLMISRFRILKREWIMICDEEIELFLIDMRKISMNCWCLNLMSKSRLFWV